MTDTIILDGDLLRVLHALTERRDRLRCEGWHAQAEGYQRTLALFEGLPHGYDYRLEPGHYDAADGFIAVSG